MGLHEFNPAMLDDASRDMASYYFFRRTHETFSFYGDQSTGMRLFNGFRLMVLAGGFEALSILAGSLPGGMVAGSQADMLRQFGHVLFNPHPSASDVATAKHDRHELLKGKNAENEAGMRTLVSMFQSSFAKREIPLDRPAVMARPMGHLLGFQLRMAEREVNGDLAATLGALISLRNLDKAISTAQANIPNFRGRDLIHHLQLVFTAGFMESFTKLAGWREAHVQFDAAARSVAAHILKPRARNGHKRRKKNGHTKNGAPKPH
jgi:hypothetical protein